MSLLTSEYGEECEECGQRRDIDAASAADVSARDEQREQKKNETGQIESLCRLVPDWTLHGHTSMSLWGKACHSKHVKSPQRYGITWNHTVFSRISRSHQWLGMAGEQPHFREGRAHPSDASPHLLLFSRFRFPSFLSLFLSSSYLSGCQVQLRGLWSAVSSFCGNPDVHLKFLDKNGRQFRLR